MSDDILIREAQLDEQGLLGKLLQAVLAESLAAEREAALTAGFTVSTVEDELLAADDWYFSNVDLMNCCYFAWDGDTAVGACVVNPFVSELQYVVVLPSHRRRGIGSRLVKAGTDELARRGISHVKIDIPLTDEARGFFASLGFTTVRERATVGKALS